MATSKGFFKDSPNARAVAKEVIATTLKGERVRIGQIAVKNGYGPSIEKRPDKVTKTQAYQLEIKQAVTQMELARNRALNRLAKVENKAQYHQLIDGIDKLTKNIQLLSGNSTSNQHIIIEVSESIANKYASNDTETHDKEESDT